MALQGEKKLIGETVFGDNQVYRLEGQETGKELSTNPQRGASIIFISWKD